MHESIVEMEGVAMDKILGIYVTSDRNLDQLIQLCRSAREKGVRVKVFFTHLGTRLCADPRIAEIEALAEVALCKVGFEDNALAPADARVDQRCFKNQSWHAEMIYDCQRYITF
jgi:uncharacterized tellurite resistance protein B-like protein